MAEIVVNPLPSRIFEPVVNLRRRNGLGEMINTGGRSANRVNPPTYPGVQIDEGMRNSGFRLESGQHPLAELSRLIPEHHVPRESVTGQQAPHETNVRLEEGYLRVLEQKKEKRISSKRKIIISKIFVKRVSRIVEDSSTDFFCSLISFVSMSRRISKVFLFIENNFDSKY